MRILRTIALAIMGFMLVFAAVVTVISCTVAGAAIGLGISIMVGVTADPVNCMTTTILAGAALGWSINFMSDAIGGTLTLMRAEIGATWT